MAGKNIHYSKTFRLSAAEIDSFSEDLDSFLLEVELERQNSIRVKLSLEEALLRMRDHLGEDFEVSAFMNRRFGRPVIRITSSGDAFNPVSAAEAEMIDWSGSMMISAGMSPQYSHSNGVNTLKVVLPANHMNPALKLLLFIILGGFAGLIMRLTLSQDSLIAIDGAFFSPLFNIWTKVLITLSGPVILFMLLTEILSASNINRQGADSNGVLLRYLIMGIQAAFVSLIVSAAVFSTDISDLSGIYDGPIDAVRGFTSALSEMIAGDFLSPIVSANTPQLIILAVIIGQAISIIDSGSKMLSDIIRQINRVGLLLAEWISRLVPYVTAVFVAQEVIEHKAFLLLKLLTPTIMAAVLSLTFLWLCALYTGWKNDTKAEAILYKLLPPLITALKKGSLDESYVQAENGLIKKFGVNSNFASVSLPQGLILYMPATNMGTMAFIMFIVVNNKLEIDWLWVLKAVILIVILFASTPPVPGANLLAYMSIFTYLKIPATVLVSAMLFDLVFGIIGGALNQAILQTDIVLQAGRFGMLDQEILKKP